MAHLCALAFKARTLNHSDIYPQALMPSGYCHPTAANALDRLVIQECAQKGHSKHDNYIHCSINTRTGTYCCFRHKRSIRSLNKFGVEGFEPPNVCTKNRCLNQTWRYPKISTNDQTLRVSVGHCSRIAWLRTR